MVACQNHTTRLAYANPACRFESLSRLVYK